MSLDNKFTKFLKTMYKDKKDGKLSNDAYAILKAYLSANKNLTTNPNVIRLMEKSVAECDARAF